jgi:hypothetical protein
VVNGQVGTHHGIAYDQGQLGSNDTLPADNTFTTINSAPFLVYNYKNSKGMDFIHYVFHWNQISPGYLDPFYYYIPTMTKEPNYYGSFNKPV